MLNRLTLGAKIGGAFGLILLLVVVLGVTAINRLSAVNDRAAELRDSWVPSLSTLGSLLDSLDRVRVTEARYVMATNDTQRQLETATFKARATKVARLRAAYEPLITRGTDDEKLIDEFDRLWSQHSPAAESFVVDHAANPSQLFGDANKTIYEGAVSAILKDLDFNKAGAKQSGDAAAALTFRRVRSCWRWSPLPRCSAPLPPGSSSPISRCRWAG